MMPENLEALLNYRMEQASGAISEAEILSGANASLRSVANRIYYGMFYSVLAILTTKKLGSSKHHGALSMFNQEFIKTKVLPEQLNVDIWKAFEMKQKADYKEFVVLEKAEVDELLVTGKVFIAEIKAYLEKLKKEV